MRQQRGVIVTELLWRLAIGALFLLALTNLGCAPTLPRWEHDLQTALSGATTAVNAFIAWDKAHQHKLIVTAPNREIAAKKIANYRTARGELLKLVKSGAVALDAAMVVLSEERNNGLSSAPATSTLRGEER